MEPIAYLYELEPRDGGHCEARRWDITRRGDYIREGWVETSLYAAPSPATPEAEGQPCPRCAQLRKAYETANFHLSCALEVIAKQLKERSE